MNSLEFLRFRSIFHCSLRSSIRLDLSGQQEVGAKEEEQAFKLGPNSNWNSNFYLTRAFTGSLCVARLHSAAKWLLKCRR